MATLLEFREQYPQYNNTPDLALATSLHQKFYSKIPQNEFFKTLDISPALLIPGSESTITLPQPKVTLQDRIMGAVEIPAIIAGGLGRAITTPLARMYGEAVGGQGTPQGKAAGEEAAQAVSRQFYQPRTQTGPEIVGGLGKVLEALPPTLGATGSTLTALTGPALQQTNALIRPAIAPVKNALVNAVTKKPVTVMQGGGAASTSEDLMRQQRLDQFGIRATAGEREKNLQKQQFESDIERGSLAGISPEAKAELSKQYGAFKTGQKQDILNEFERMTEQVGGTIDRSTPRALGTLIDKTVLKLYDAKLKKVDDTYQLARDAGETKQIVSTDLLDQWLIDNAPEAISVPQIQTIGAKLKQLKEITGNKVSIDDLENLYKSAGNLAEGNPSAALFMGKVKGVINDMTEGTGGNLYRAARSERKQLAKEFENVKRVDDLLSTKAGKTDRKVALDDVYNHIVVDGSLEEMRTVTQLLKKGGPEGQKAYQELQGYTVQRMKDLLLKKSDNETDKIVLNNFNNFVTQLDREDKLAYMFGKTGRNELIDLKQTINDVIAKEPGAVNYSGTGSVVVRALDKFLKMTNKIPGSKSVAEMLHESQAKKQLEKALEQPNKLIPEVPSTNALKP
jgi:hypothetical protein